MRQHDVEWSASSRSAALEQGGLEPAPMLVRAFEIHHLVGAAVDGAADSRESRKMDRVFQHEGVGRARIEPDLDQIVDLFVVFGLVLLAEEPLLGARSEPCVRALLLEGAGDTRIDVFVVQDLVAALANEYRQRHAPGALSREHPVGLARHHALDAVLAGGRNPARLLDRLERDLP